MTCLVLMGLMRPALVVAQNSGTSGSELTASDSLDIPDEGFSGDTDSEIDYQALIKELYGNEDTVSIAEEPAIVPQAKSRKQRQVIVGPAPGLFPRSALNGSHIAFTAASPFLVAGPLESWYSYIDGSMTLKLPFEVYVESLPLYLLFEVSSFNFENSHPEGGEFKGLAYILEASVIGDNSGALVGFGFWDRSMGSLMELNYRFRPTKNTFLRFATRGVLITDVEPLGATWWLEFRISTGLEL